MLFTKRVINFKLDANRDSQGHYDYEPLFSRRTAKKPHSASTRETQSHSRATLPADSSEICTTGDEYARIRSGTTESAVSVPHSNLQFSSSEEPLVRSRWCGGTAQAKRATARHRVPECESGAVAWLASARQKASRARD